MKRDLPLEQKLYSQIRDVIQQARSKAYRSVNFIMVEAYWNVGRLILEEEQQGRKRAGYGDYLIARLAEKLQNEFGKGFDERNLRNMRAFYQSFPIWNAVRSESEKPSKKPSYCVNFSHQIPAQCRIASMH